MLRLYFASMVELKEVFATQSGRAEQFIEGLRGEGILVFCS